jgi:ABC-type sugar transport system ATPase subunit
MIEAVALVKRFGGARALEDVSLAVAPGTVHAIVGENGAGKSTLGRVLCGILRPDAGEVRLDGVPVRWRDPREALAAGVAMVHQELAVCPDLSVAENIALGRWPRRGLLVDRAAMVRRAEELLDEIGARLPVRAPMRSLSVAQEQLVQIATALGTGARLLVLDEPTSSLSQAEAERLLELVEDLRGRGTTVVYVSHRLPEVLRLADAVSVLRDGRLVATLPRADASAGALVRLMVGRDLPAAALPGRAPGAPLLEVQGLSSPGLLQDVSFDVRAGEIVGLAGLVGAGRSELARALFGLDPRARGRVTLGGRPLRLGSPRAALAAGLALLPEDRKRQGLLLGWGARANWSLPRLAAFRRGPLLDRRREARAAAEALAAADVRGADLEAPVAALSGGNQQKVALAKWLAVGARVLLADEPTRGVDVGAKAAIHMQLRAVADEGRGVLFISSELPELLAVADRVLVLRGGRIVAELARGAGEEEVLREMAGVGVH